MPTKNEKINNRERKKDSKKKENTNGKYSSKHIRIQEELRAVSKEVKK
tara:strand:- start:1164 stop:1307 length:144 start_codon:yes stop_codon:yes gene_type:complete